MEKYLQTNERPFDFFRNPDCPVGEIYQGRWEFTELLKMYSIRRPKRVLEIGSMFGGTLWHWFQTHPERLVVIDKLVPSNNSAYPAHVASHREFYNWAAQSRGTWFSLIESDSTAESTVAKVKGERFDFLFIDGDHSYKTARADFLNYGPLVEDGGLIVFHDILPAPMFTEIEVHRLWREIQEAGYVTQELLSSHSQPNFGIGVVHL